MTTCPDCHETYAECQCHADEDAEVEAREAWPRCGCKYCFCSSQTEYGEPCSMCSMHAHQG